MPEIKPVADLCLGDILLDKGSRPYFMLLEFGYITHSTRRPKKVTNIESEFVLLDKTRLGEAVLQKNTDLPILIRGMDVPGGKAKYFFSWRMVKNVKEVSAVPFTAFWPGCGKVISLPQSREGYKLHHKARDTKGKFCVKEYVSLENELYSQWLCMVQ